jgi:cell division protein ZapA
MAQVTIEVNGRAYTVGCEDGQEAHLAELARHFDDQVRLVSQEVGHLTETRLFLMGALLMADEMSDLRLRLAHAQADLAHLQAESGRAEARAAEVVVAAAKRVEALAAKAG